MLKFFGYATAPIIRVVGIIALCFTHWAIAIAALLALVIFGMPNGKSLNKSLAVRLVAEIAVLAVALWGIAIFPHPLANVAWQWAIGLTLASYVASGIHGYSESRSGHRRF